MSFVKKKKKKEASLRPYYESIESDVLCEVTLHPRLPFGTDLRKSLSNCSLFFTFFFFFASKIHRSLTALILAIEWTHQSPHWLHCEGDRMHPKPRQCLVLLFTLMHILSLVQSQGKTLQIERRCCSTCGLIAITAFVLFFFCWFVFFPLRHTLHSWTIQAKQNAIRWQFRHQQPGWELPRCTERESQLQARLQWFLQNDLLRRPLDVQRQQVST